MVGLAMANNKAVLVKVLDAKPPLELGATFTGEVKEARKVSKAFLTNMT